MKNWFEMHNAIQRRCYTSEVPAVQAATSSVFSDTKQMRCEASVVAVEGREGGFQATCQRRKARAYHFGSSSQKVDSLVHFLQLEDATKLIRAN